MDTPKITVVGSLNMDLVISLEVMPQIGETVHGDSIHYIPGGKGANQAVGCARLGADVTMIGAVGDDLFGKRILEEMEQYGLSQDGIFTLKNESTGIASIYHTKEDNSIAIVPGTNGKLTPEMVKSYRDVIAASDIVLLQLEIPMETVHESLRIARSSGVKTVLNPAPVNPLSPELLQLVDVITPNETEFEMLIGKKADRSDAELFEAIRTWESKFGNKLIVTRGKHGATHIIEGKLEHVTAPLVEVVDTTGAGDCFNAALSYGLAKQWEWKEILSFAVRAASISVTKFGAQGGMPTLGQITNSTD
ncbi:ribokinase [Evansella vedderi]|uniref:Ribokinase n=1 Tax=Evansella vedderi TaxID=38282 RepID=A0ABT9ZQF4_9BACI|nr:ribokinase [Evansella vedderi]MDQ0253470.1 ribokinase [Evansella vedderi]